MYPIFTFCSNARLIIDLLMWPFFSNEVAVFKLIEIAQKCTRVFCINSNFLFAPVWAPVSKSIPKVICVRLSFSTMHCFLSFVRGHICILFLMRPDQHIYTLAETVLVLWFHVPPQRKICARSLVKRQLKKGHKRVILGLVTETNFGFNLMSSCWGVNKCFIISLGDISGRYGTKKIEGKY